MMHMSSVPPGVGPHGGVQGGILCPQGGENLWLCFILKAKGWENSDFYYIIATILQPITIARAFYMEWRSEGFFSEKQFGNLYLAVMCQVTYSVFIDLSQWSFQTIRVDMFSRQPSRLFQTLHVILHSGDQQFISWIHFNKRGKKV